MPAEIPTSEPSQIFKGSTTEWTKSLADFDPATATVTYGFSKSDGTESFSVAASDNGDGTFLVTVAPADLSALTPGDWRLQGWATEGGKRSVFYVGRFVLRADFVAGGADERASVEYILDGIETLLKGKPLKDSSSYSIGTRSLSTYSFEELISAQKFYRAEKARLIRQERIEQGLGHTGKIRSRMP